MGGSDREVRIGTGRRGGDGRLRLSVFAADLLAVALEGHGERAPTLLLTREQAERLRDALDELLPLVGTSLRGEAKWQGAERRRRASSAARD
jgi:hypothetical protein